MSESYDIGLLVLSLFAGTLGFFTGLVLTTGLRGRSQTSIAARIIMGGISTGLGLWSMHFIALLGLKIPVAFDLRNLWPLLPLFMAILCSTAAFYLLFFRRSLRYGRHAGALTMSIGLGIAYYFGVKTICAGCTATFSWLGAAAIALLYFAFTEILMWFAARERRAMETFAGALIAGTVAAIINFSALQATQFIFDFDESARTIASQISTLTLALSVAGAAYAMCSLSLFVFAYQELPKLPSRPQPALIDRPGAARTPQPMNAAGS